MDLKVGTDIVHIPRVRKLMQNEGFIKKVFHPSESKDYSAEHLAGIFAAKEAFFKAVNKKPRWLDVEVKKKRTGRPFLVSNENIKSIDLSISHEKEYAIATVLLIKK